MGAGFCGTGAGAIVEPGAMGIAELGADIGLMLLLSSWPLSMSAE
jgi:hypothetical protein